ncbi:MAG: ABC transporter permease [Tissierellia bacterium]|nr:ABC transporter permease [Tissierellia bacterium]
MKINKKYIYYEWRNVIGNWYIPFFGLLFPVLLYQLIARSVLKDVPQEFLPQSYTEIFISFLQLVPLAVVFLGHGSTYSQDLENKIPQRMELFGFSQKEQIIGKFIALFFFFIIALGVQFINAFLSFDILKPKLLGLTTLLGVLLILSIILFVLAHGIANFFRKFGPTYGVVMTLYFGFMMLGGMMGVNMDQLPEKIQVISRLIPFSYISNDFVKVWSGEPYNMAPFIQSCILLLGISILVLLLSEKYGKKDV